MIKYRKAKELIDQVADDLSAYDDQGLIDYGHLYKILRRCNEVLGHKINPEKQEIIRIKNFRSVAPSDFMTLNFAFVCSTKDVRTDRPSGFHVEYQTCSTTEKSCNVCLTECDNEIVIVQKLDENWTQFKNLETVAVSPNSRKKCTGGCPNVTASCDKMIDIGDDLTITTTFQTGDLYLNYVGSMDDADENLLIIDDALIEPYYENELIKYILKFIVYNRTGDVAELYKDAKIEASRAKIDALRYVATPGYTEMQDLWQSQRSRLYRKYFLPIIGY